MSILLMGGCAAYPSPGRAGKPDHEFYDIVRLMDPWSRAIDNEHVERARALAPHIEAWADQIERDRRIVEPVLDALFAATARAKRGSGRCSFPRRARRSWRCGT